MDQWSPGEAQSRMYANFKAKQHEINQRQEELDQHHNTAPNLGERKRSWFVVRVIRRLLGRK